MLIRSAAHFVVCECGRHGKLVTADGEETIEFCSKEKVRSALNDGIKAGKITSFEVGEAMRQINASSLAELEQDVGIIEHLVAEALNDENESLSHLDEAAVPHMRYKN